MKKSLSSLLFLVCLLPGAGWSAGLFWTNSGTGNWDEPVNWSPEAVPTFSDQAVIGQGHAQVDAGAEANMVSIAGTGALTVLDGGALVVDSTVALSGSGVATVTGTGSTLTTLHLSLGTSGTTSFTIANGGAVTVSSGEVTIGQNGSVATLNIGSPGVLSPTAGGALDAESVVLDSSLASINFNHTGAVTFSADISGAGSVVKRGSGTTTFTEASNSSYTGGTVIEAGTLIVDGSTGAVEVQSGATLQGDGTVGQIDLQSGSKLIPIDCFYADDLNWSPDATMEFGLGGGGGANILGVDFLRKAETENPMPSYAFTFTDAGWEVDVEYLLILFTDTNFAPGNFSFTNTNGFTGEFLLEDYRLTFKLLAIPEPSAFVLLGLGLAVYGLARRRR